MSTSANYAAILRVWPGVREQFRSQPAIPEADLLTFLRRTIPNLSTGVWRAGREALLRNQLLYLTPDDGCYALLPSGRSRVFAPVLELAWLDLWEQVRGTLALPPRCLWATHWLQPVLPDLPTVLGLEVNWSEVPAAVRLVNRLGTFRPVTSLDAAVLNTAQPTPLLLVQPWPRRAPNRLVRLMQNVPTARLEKLVVDMPAVLPDFPLSLTAWLARVRHSYPLDSNLVDQYREYRNQLAGLPARAAWPHR